MAKWLEYEFTSYPTDAEWHRLQHGGVYIFVKNTTRIFPEALYVGETGNFAERLPGHERWGEALRRGMNQVHICSFKTEHDRKNVESALIARYDPPMNISDP